MNHALMLLIEAATAFSGSVPAYVVASAADGGRLGTLPVGEYLCALPGDAAGPAWRPLDGKTFSIGNASTYRTSSGAGTYLLAGDDITFTRGPMKGMRFKRTSPATLRWINDDGKPGNVRCVRTTGSR